MRLPSKRAGGAEADVVVDARWIGFTGIGRFLVSMLEGLHELEPPGRWVLWGPPEVADLCWPGAEHRPAAHSPLPLAGQREALTVPPGRVMLWTHVIHPLLPRRSLVVVYDTIPLRWGSPGRRLAFRALYLAATRTADAVLTISEATAGRAVEDLGVRPDKLRPVPVPVSTALAERVRARRREVTPDPRRVLYVGQVAPHKNLERALQAFALSEVSRAGGSFTLVGGRPESLPQLAEAVDRLPPGTRVDLVARCSDAELIDLYAGAGLVVLPSLEEGYGLPAVEALDAGIPLCCSDIPALREATRGLPELFDPADVADMARAITTTSRRAQDGTWAEVDLAWAQVAHPSALDLARAVADAVEQVGDRRRTARP